MSPVTDGTPEIETYIGRLRRQLRFMPGGTKKNILEEARSHLNEMALEKGTLSPENAKAAIAGFGEPKALAREYKRLYGYSKFFSVMFILAAFFMGILTVPVSLPAFNRALTTANNICLLGNVLLVIFLFAVIIFAGVKFGRWTGLFTGLAAFASRGLTVVVILSLLSRIDENLSFTTSGGPCFFMIVVSVMMPLVGFLAGRALERYRKKKSDIDWD